jgi:hypothetical protein
MIITERQDWRRPIDAHAEETYDLESGEPQRSIMWYLKGKFQEEDAVRLAQGLACGVCLSTFPARPAMENIRDFRPIAHEWEPVRSKDEVLAMIAQNKCPTCASEVSSQMHNALHRGLDPLRPKDDD